MLLRKSLKEEEDLGPTHQGPDSSLYKIQCDFQRSYSASLSVQQAVTLLHRDNGSADVLVFLVLRCCPDGRTG